MSSRINLDALIGPPIYTEDPGEVSAWGSVGRKTCETAPARRRVPLPLAGPRLIAIKKCSPAELLDDPVVGFVTMSDGVDRQILELFDRDGWSDGFVRRGRRMRTIWALGGPRALAASDRSNRRHEIRPDIPAFPMVLREAGAAR
jgi:hypothetical protein